MINDQLNFKNKKMINLSFVKIFQFGGQFIKSTFMTLNYTTQTKFCQ